MYLIDTHCHLFDISFTDDLDDVIARAVDNDVNKYLLPNLDADTVESVFALSDKFEENCFPMLGLHPCNVGIDFKKDIEAIFGNFSRKIYGIGEIGLDYFHNVSFKKQQNESLEIQLTKAKDSKLPVSLHTRNATDDVLYLIKKIKNEVGVFHCFTEDYSFAKKIIDLGFFLGIGGIITFKNNSIKDVIKKIPLKYIVLETDSPYLSPVPFRGKRNEPSNIKIIAEKYAKICGIELEEVIETTTNNARKIFNI